MNPELIALLDKLHATPTGETRSAPDNGGQTGVDAMVKTRAPML